MDATEPAPLSAGITPRHTLIGKARRFYEEHEPLCTVIFFVAGFLFDTMAVGRIDRLHNIIHQAAYLSLCALFTSWEMRELYGRFVPYPRLEPVWRYHAGATHFMLGTLLNIYTLFFFKSASFSTSFLFLIILAGLLSANELKPFKNSGTTLRMSLFSLCLLSYFTYLIPLLVGSIGVGPFIGSMAAATAVVGGLAFWLKKSLEDQRHVILRHLIIPFAIVEIMFAGLYFAKLIPPVPLSLSYIGVYHDAHRVGDRFELISTRSRWRFWERADETFYARPGDKIHCFVSVFSPARFKDRLELHWLFYEPGKGWIDSGDNLVVIEGGRDDGYRADVTKAKYRSGKWRVSVQTSDHRELGGTSLTIREDASTSPRPERIIWR